MFKGKNKQVSGSDSSTEDGVFFRHVFEHATVGIARIALDGTWLLVNPEVCAVFRCTEEELIGTAVQDMMPADDAEKFGRSLRQLKNPQSERFSLELRFNRKDGKEIWVQQTAALHYNESCAAPYIISLIQDITEQKKTEESNIVLIRELDHRVKNVLHNILSVAKQTARRSASMDEFLEAFQGRVLAFAHLHRLLAKSEWCGAQLVELLRMVVKPCTTGEGPFVRLEGPPVRLSNPQTQSLYLLLHEMVSNASRYGALSSREGEIFVTWRTIEENGGKRLQLHWVERNGPKVAQPPRTGFGGKLIQMILQHELKGNIKFDFKAEGLAAELSFPLSFSEHRQGKTGTANFTLMLVTDAALPDLAAAMLENAGFRIIGPEENLDFAREHLDRQQVDGVFLAVGHDFQKETSFARELMHKDIPFILVKDEGGCDLPEDIQGLLVLARPVATDDIMRGATALASFKQF